MLCGPWAEQSRSCWAHRSEKGFATIMADAGSRPHGEHKHIHGSACGHVAVSHDGHVDYLHDGHLHHAANGTVMDHEIASSPENPAACTPAHQCGSHDANHVHGDGCGHEA